MTFSGVYALVHRRSGGAYVGSARQITKRWGEHVGLLNSGRHHAPRLQDLWLLDGPGAFAFVVLEQCVVEALVEREREWIGAFESILNASRSVRPHTDAWRARVSATKMGHTVSEATRAKISAAHRAKWATPGVRERLSAAQRAGWASKPASRARMSEATRAYWQREGKQAAQNRARHASQARWAKARQATSS